MRYWKPFVEEAARAVEAWEPDEVVLLPLYPQFSTTTTGSSLKAWRRAYDGPARGGLLLPGSGGVRGGLCDSIRRTAEGAARPLRLLFSAHGCRRR
jgi:ferrochelatase